MCLCVVSVKDGDIGVETYNNIMTVLKFPMQKPSVQMIKMRSFLLRAFSFWFFLSFCSAQNIAAFYSTKGPTVMSLDSSTGNFVYNVFAQKGFSSMRSFVPTFPPKNGTSIACVGYSSSTSIYVCWSEQCKLNTNETQGSIFYQTPNNSLAQQIFKCSYASGNCVNYGAYPISLNVTVPVRSGTGLSAALLSTDLGYRVSYEDIHGSLRQISYSNNTEGVVTPWADGVLTSNLTSANGSALSTTYIQSPNATAPAQQTVYQLSNDQILSMIDNRTTAINETQVWFAGM